MSNNLSSGNVFTLGLLLIVGVQAGAARAGAPEGDKAGGSDHPLVSRYMGSVLHTFGNENFASVPVVVDGKGKPEEQRLEGKVANRLYFGPTGRSVLEVFRNYQAALRDAGFEVIYQCDEERCERDDVQGKLYKWVRRASWTGNDSSNAYVLRIFEYKPGFHYLHARRAGVGGRANVQIAVRTGENHDPRTADRALQFVQVIESSSIEQGRVSVNAAGINNALKRDGRIALYGVLFDTNEARIKAESSDTLVQIAKALADDPALNVFIVGHTDNQGSVENNLVLSRRRALAVVDALARNHGIAAARLQAHGLANLAPSASNHDDAGRARNRRVEMVVR